MCRWLLKQSKIETSSHEILQRFADMAKKSKALDGDWQGDGWGVAWLDEQRVWRRYTSLAPVWEDGAAFAQVPATTILAIHARSASFPHQKGVLDYNQPYIADDHVFVFNGLLKGVTLPDVPGRIGAEKIWSLVQRELVHVGPQEALEQVKATLLAHSKEIVALNLGLATKDDIASLNQFSRHPEYYALHHWNEGETRFICSESLV